MDLFQDFFVSYDSVVASSRDWFWLPFALDLLQTRQGKLAKPTSLITLTKARLHEGLPLGRNSAWNKPNISLLLLKEIRYSGLPFPL